MTEQQLPEGWQMVKFGDIAKHISKRVEPSETDLEIYVGLEHLDSDSLKIKRHGTPSDVEGQKLLVKKGQIIFGKRRAYQRKVAVADWDCICSAHAMVLEANSEKIIPEFCRSLCSLMCLWNELLQFLRAPCHQLSNGKY